MDGPAEVLGGKGLGNFSNFGKYIGGMGKNFMSGEGRMGGLSNIFRDKNKAGNYEGQGFNVGKLALGGLGAASLALPFMGGGGDDEESSGSDPMDPAAVTQRARNYYSGAGDAGVGLDFMPKKKYVSQNFYAADGGRAGYAMGGSLDEDEEDYIRSGAGQSRRHAYSIFKHGWWCRRSTSRTNVNGRICKI